MRSQAGFAIQIVLLLAAAPAVAEEPVPDGQMRASDCLGWIEETYRIPELSRDFGLDLAEAYATARECVEHDTTRMQPIFPISWCDNVFKIHCSTLDLLAEIAEAEVSRCGEQLGAALGIDPGQHKAWRTCAQNVIFDRYSLEGRSSDGAACRAALLEECGRELDPAAADPALSADSLSFIECCSAESFDREAGDAGSCGMIDDGFTRGPCLDHPVCVNRLSGDWLSCSG